MIILQPILYCLLFTVLVKFAAGNNAVNALYFYPKAVQNRAVELGLSNRVTTDRRFRHFMIALFIDMAAALLLIIGLWNRVSDFGTAYLQALLFLEVLNWYDGIVIDKLWVGHSRFWAIPKLKHLPYVQTWRQMFKKRLFLSLVWAVVAAIAALTVVLIF